MAKIRLICWNEDDAKKRAASLAEAGVIVDASPLNPSGLVSAFTGVTAVCIDLDRVPSHGREVAVALRQSKATRHIPIIFAGGEKFKVERIRKELPDASYVLWVGAASALRKTMKKPAPDPLPVKAAPGFEPEPVKPPSHMERYSGSSLVKKLGIEAKMAVALIGAPDGFEEQLGDLPEGVTFPKKMTQLTRLAMWFVRSRADLEREIVFMADRVGPGYALWIISPKQGSKKRADFNQTAVRAIALKAGLVDYKVCSVDEDWTGLKFARKK